VVVVAPIPTAEVVCCVGPPASHLGIGVDVELKGGRVLRPAAEVAVEDDAAEGGLGLLLEGGLVVVVV